MKRFLISLTTMVSLLIASRIYSAVITPLVTAPILTMSDRPAQDVSIRPPTSFENQAMKVFPESIWTHKAGQAWEIAESVTMYFQDYQRVPGSGNTIEISPIAVVWTDPDRPDSAPYRMQAERAQVKFQNAFFDKAISLTDSNPGRIVWASLEGLVKIDGPDGLLIHGENFKFEEESLQLYSDFPIEFSYGPTPEDERTFRGTSMQIQMSFLPATESTIGRDMPRIAGLSEILLRRNVNLESTFKQKGVPRQVTLNSRGFVLYDVVNKICSVDDQVEVRSRSWEKGIWTEDLLVCDWLRLVLKQVFPTQTAGAKSPSKPDYLASSSSHSFSKEFEGLELETASARGAETGPASRLRFTSSSQSLTAEMESFNYSVPKREVVLQDYDFVLVHRGDLTFKCPEVTLVHTPDQKGIERLDCVGAGTLEIYEKKFGDQPILARWTENVLVHPEEHSPLHLIELNDEAQISLPEQMGLSADHLYLWVDLLQLQEENSKENGAETLVDTGVQTLALHRARARGNVNVLSKQVQIQRNDVIDVFITPGQIEYRDDEAGLFQQSDRGKREDSDQPDYPAQLSADQIAIDLVFDSSQPKDRQFDFRQFAAQGQVSLYYQPRIDLSSSSKISNGVFKLLADALTVENRGGNRQVLKLKEKPEVQGQAPAPATLSLGEQSLWGRDITISRSENRIDVKGRGGISSPAPTQKSSSNPVVSASPGMMDLVWEDGMSFNGVVAHCWGKITATLPNDNQDISRLLCEDLKATLDRRISFQNPEKTSDQISVQLIEAKHNVIVESREWEQNKLVGMRKAEIASFKLNQATGEFSGIGPGIAHSWSLGDNVNLAPKDSPKANLPDQAENDQKWRFVSVRFSGDVSGNMNHNEALLTDRVKMITAPVSRPGVAFEMNELSQKTPEAENAVMIECQKLKIIRKLIGKDRTQFFEFQALNDAHLESHVCHAYADELTYDQRAGLFVMRGLGKDAVLYVQRVVGAPPHLTSAKDITFDPVTWKISTDGLKGFSSGN